MNNTKLIFFDFSELYEIFLELNNYFKYELIEIENKKTLDIYLMNSDNYLIISKKKLSNVNNELIIDELPKHINLIIEKINISILKNNFFQNSKIKIKDYEFDLNSRKMLSNNKFLKLTEKEIKIITYLADSKRPSKIIDLQSKIWGYADDLETHTVETHIHRLRKKIFETYQDNNFIISTKNGYQIS